MDFGFSVPVYGTGIWHFPALGFCFLAGRSRNHFGFAEIVSGLAPFVRAVAGKAFG
jgi:hypothetical protein